MPQDSLSPVDAREVSAAIAVEGMNCASCVAHVEKAALKVPGVAACQVNLARGRAVVRFDADHVTPSKVALAITASGYPAEPEGPAGAAAEQHRLSRQKNEADAWTRRAVVGIILWLPLELTHWTLYALGHRHAMPAQATAMGWAELLLASVAMVYVGSKFFASAVRRTAAADQQHGHAHLDGGGGRLRLQPDLLRRRVAGHLAAARRPIAFISWKRAVCWR